MKLIYIAGPYRGENAHEVEMNIRAAEEWILPLAKLGVVPQCVHSMYRYFDGTMTGEFWLDATMEVMRRCDAVLLVGQWAVSEGSVKEREEAERLGIRVFENNPHYGSVTVLNAIRRWLEQRSARGLV